MNAPRIGHRSWLPSRRLARRSRGVVLGGVWLRCRAWWRAQHLDRQLARGADPMSSDELSLRTGQLGSASTRERLACALRGAVELAGRQPDPWLSSALIGRQAIRENQELLLALAERLSTREPVGVEGLATASLLITDPSSPLYHDDASRSLAVTAYDALARLAHGHLSAPAPDR